MATVVDNKPPHSSSQNTSAAHSSSTPQPPPSVLDTLEGFEWSTQDAVAYEVALEAIREVMGYCSAHIAAERAKPVPDQQVIDQWRGERAQCAAFARSLDATDKQAVAQVRSQYSRRARQLRATL